MTRYTHDEILAMRSERGGYTRETLKKLGVNWPPVQGWLRRYLAGLDPNEPNAEVVKEKKEEAPMVIDKPEPIVLNVALDVGKEYTDVQLDFLTKLPWRETRMTYLGRHPYDHRHLFASETGGTVMVPDGGVMLGRIRG